MKGLNLVNNDNIYVGFLSNKNYKNCYEEGKF